MANQVNPNIMMEYPDFWRLPLENYGVERIEIDYQFSLFFSETQERYYSIQIESEIQFTTGDQIYKIDPAGEVVSVCPLLLLLHQKVKRALAFKNGNLEIVFLTDSRLLVLADPNYEAWNINGPNGLLLVSLPGGGLGKWRGQ
jgi:hypothetical protein